MSGPPIENGAIAFADGRITAVGPNDAVQTPEGAEELDLTGRFVSPGIIDAHSHLGVYATPELVATSDGNEMTAPVTAEVSAEHGFWPQDPGLRRAAAAGVTAMLVLPGSANLIGGRGFPVKLHFGTSAAAMRFPGAPDALKMACGENPMRVYGRERKAAPGTRMGNVAGYRQAFAAAQDYRAKLKHWREKAERSPQEAGPAPLRDLRMETLAGVLDGQILVQNHCYRADEMALMLKVAEEFGFRIRAFHHALEAYKIRGLLKEQDVAIATWADWWGFKLEAWDGIPQNAALLAQVGGRPVIHSDSALGIQRLNQEAAKAQSAAHEAGIGISDDEALKWITLNPAWVMGVHDRTGSLEVGKMADLAVWNRHPLSVYARVERTYADGVVTFDIKEGVADVSDFELGAQSAPVAKLATAAGKPPELAEGRCGADGALCRPIPVQPGDTCWAITNVTLVEAAGPRKQTDVLVRNGQIAAIGASDAAGCRRIDGAGKVLTAGLIDPFTALGIVEIPLEEHANDTGPRGEAAKQPIHAALRASDSLNPASELFAVARLGGVVAGFTVPSGGLVSGQSALVM
ncbi:MAG: amidohydrolase family protein, partial [Myxococcales bacterium]